MEKNKLVEFIQRLGSSTDEEVLQLLSLRDEYPYCQVLHALAARISRDHNLANQQEILQRAAVVSTDRAVLKEIMSATAQVAALSQPETQVPVTETDSASHDFAEEVFKDLEKLKLAKQAFESLADTPAKLVIEPVKKSLEPPKSQREVLKSKKQRIVEMAKKLSADSVDPHKNQSAEPSGKQKDKADPLIEEIKTTRKKIKPENKRTQEQIEIINQFIKTKPAITPSRSAANQGADVDLSDAIKGGEFGDHIVSETLVDVLLKQGKKDKAIEVLKKLIWKFPQKKTYFAARIDELKK